MRRGSVSMRPMLSRPLALVLAAALAAVAAPARAVTPLDLIPAPAKDAAPAAERSAAPKAPEAIPLPGVVPSAVEAYRTLAGIRAKIDPDTAIDDLLAPLDDVAKAVARAGAQFGGDHKGGLSDRDIVDLRQEVRRQDDTLARWSGKIEDQVKVAYGAQKDLARMAEVWALTARDARAADAPAELVARAEDVRREVQKLQAQTRERLDKLLAAQERVASLRIQILGWLQEADRADALREKQLFEIEARPLWHLFDRREPTRDFTQQVRRIFEHNVSAVRAFVREEGDSLGWLAAIFVVLVGVIGWVGRRFAARAGEDPDLARPAEVLKHPVAAAALVTFILTATILPRAPAAFRELAVLLMLPPVLVLAHAQLPPQLRTPLFRLAALAAVARIGAILPEYSLPGRLLVLVIGLLTLAGAVDTLRPGTTWLDAVHAGPRRTRLRAMVAGLAALVGAAVVANVVGNVTLARRLVDGALSTALLALVLAAVARVLRALLTGALHMPEVRRVHALAENVDEIARRGGRLVDWAARIVWALGVLIVFHVYDPVTSFVASVFTTRLKLGGLDLSLGDVATFGVSLWVSVLLARLLRVILETRLERDVRLPSGVPVAVAKTVSYLVVGVGFLFAILASGMDVTRFTVILGTLSVGIGFGLQNVVNNFVSGLILLYERPIRIGDVIDVGTAVGTVSHIGIRSSTLKTFQGAEVVVPNSNLVSNQLTNWTLSDQVRRVEIDVGVAYGSDVVKVQEILTLAAGGNVDVLSNPAPVAFFMGFGDSSLDFQLRFWTPHFDRYVGIASAVRAAILQKLDAAGISIPFPQRDLHVVSVDEPAARALRGPGAVRGPGPETR